MSDLNLGHAANPSSDPGDQLGNGTLRTTRGGLFNGWPAVCRSASAIGLAGAQRGPGLGFRLVRSAL